MISKNTLKLHTSIFSLIAIFILPFFITVPTHAATEINVTNIGQGSCNPNTFVLDRNSENNSFECTFPLSGDLTGLGYELPRYSGIYIGTKDYPRVADCSKIENNNLICEIDDDEDFIFIGQLDLVISFIEFKFFGFSLVAQTDTVETINITDDNSYPYLQYENIQSPANCTPNPVLKEGVVDCVFNLVGDFEQKLDGGNEALSFRLDYIEGSECQINYTDKKINCRIRPIIGGKYNSKLGLNSHSFSVYDNDELDYLLSLPNAISFTVDDFNEYFSGPGTCAKNYFLPGEAITCSYPLSNKYDISPALDDFTAIVRVDGYQFEGNTNCVVNTNNNTVDCTLTANSEPLEIGQYEMVPFFSTLYSEETYEDYGATFNVANEPCFPDVELNDFVTFICNLKDDGVIGGYPDGTYKPDNNVSRGEMAKFIVNAFNVPINTNCENFIDIPVGSPFYEEITSLKCNGIVNGYPDGTYQLSRTVSRGEMSKFIINASGIAENTSCNQFSDIPADFDFASYIQTLKCEEIINGFPDGTYRPFDVVSRGAMAKFIDNSRD